MLVTECGNGRPPRHLIDYYQIPPGPGRCRIFVDFPVNNEEMHVSGYVSHTQQSSIIRLLLSRQLLVLEERSGCIRGTIQCYENIEFWYRAAERSGDKMLCNRQERKLVTKRIVMITHSPTLHITALLYYDIRQMFHPNALPFTLRIVVVFSSLL